MCANLRITIVPANTPQAKGRIERKHGMRQERLVKKLRRRGSADVSAGNAYLATEYRAATMSALLRRGPRRRISTWPRHAPGRSRRPFASNSHAGWRTTGWSGITQVADQ